MKPGTFNRGVGKAEGLAPVKFSADLNGNANVGCEVDQLTAQSEATSPVPEAAREVGADLPGVLARGDLHQVTGTLRQRWQSARHCRHSKARQWPS